MSDQANEAVELPPSGNSAFATLMDTLVADEAETEAGQGTPPAADATGADGGPDPKGGAADPGGAPAAGDPGVPAADGGPDGAAAPTTPAAGTGAAATPTTPDAGGDGGAGAAATGPGAGDRPAAWTTPAVELAPKLGDLANAFEERTVQAYQQSALEEVKTQHVQYFTALEKHPRLLVGTEVPAIGKEGTEVLRDAQDAKDWQEAVKSLLVGEVRDRASKAMDENADFLTTVHASIELFQKNHDLIPGTAEFDVDLANRFASLAAPYELRVDGKLQGYSIPVQPIIEQLRTALVAERSAKAPAEPAGAPPAKPPADPPQAGVASKAGTSSEAEDFSTLFGTIGLPDLKI